MHTTSLTCIPCLQLWTLQQQTLLHQPLRSSQPSSGGSTTMRTFRASNFEKLSMKMASKAMHSSSTISSVSILCSCCQRCSNHTLPKPSYISQSTNKNCFAHNMLLQAISVKSWIQENQLRFTTNLYLLRWMDEIQTPLRTSQIGNIHEFDSCCLLQGADHDLITC